MFTGIITTIATIISVHPLSDAHNAGVRLIINVNLLLLDSIKLGDSIALNGACVTVICKTTHNFTVEVSKESLNVTTGLNTLGEVNLETALALNERLNGHFVFGHIDGLGIIRKFKHVNESYQLVIEAPKILSKYLVYKGSIVVNGVSLTINSIKDTATHCYFSINLVPYTIQITTLKYLKVNNYVNLEIDMIAKYVDRILSVLKL